MLARFGGSREPGASTKKIYRTGFGFHVKMETTSLLDVAQTLNTECTV